MTNEKTLLISWLKMILEYMIIFKKFQQVKDMILQLFVCQTLIMSKNITVQQINFTGNLENQSTIFFIFEEAKETVLDFSEGTVKVF